MTIRGRSGRNVTGLQGANKVLIRVLIQLLARKIGYFRIYHRVHGHLLSGHPMQRSIGGGYSQTAGIVSERS
jgi:hypothetical protein